MPSPPSHSLLEPSLRWFGPNDPVPLSFLRQAGARAVFTSLHQIPYGEAWPAEQIRERKRLIENSGLRWSVAESLPVHEHVKAGRGDLAQLFTNYTTTLRRLAAEGIHTVVYNFMPVLDWIRTDMAFVLPDGARSMRFDPVHFAAFDVYALRRAEAEEDHPHDIQLQAKAWWDSLDDATKAHFVRSIIDVFPGVKWNLSLNDIRTMLAQYSKIDEDQLRRNLARFLGAVVPTAEELGIRLAIHPDDPPFPVLGLPRIVSTESQISDLLALIDSPAHGLCFCAGSLGARHGNDLCSLVSQHADRIHALHLRNTTLESGGAFHEAGHLEGTSDLVSILRSFLKERSGAIPVAFRPDHGLAILDDLEKPEGITPGYSAIGRLKGLAEIKGVLAGMTPASLDPSPDA